MAEKKEVVKVYMTQKQKDLFKDEADREEVSLSNFLLEAAANRVGQTVYEIKSDDIMQIATQIYEVEKDIRLIVETAQATNSVVKSDVIKIENKVRQLENWLAENLMIEYKNRKKILAEVEKAIK